uniref:Lactonase family protein n=1 Tax=Heligmosomoides polygyrus TaxID=6339 RepID=A0A183FCH0_HELPZ
LMQVASVNDVKIYNLSAGKSIPEACLGPIFIFRATSWMNSEARRRAERKSLGGSHGFVLLLYEDVRRRVQLIQDFEMPDISGTVDVSRDGRYVFAT